MRVRRLRAVAVAATAAMALLTGCGSDDESSVAVADNPTFPAGTTMARLAEAGEMTVGTKFDQPLFGLRGSGDQPVGFDVEIAKIVAGELGIAGSDVTFTETVSANREPFIQQGTVDMVAATYTINDKRKEVVGFAGPYYIAGQDIMKKKGDASITGLDSLAGKRVCSVTGSTPAAYLMANAPMAELTLFDTYSKCADALKQDRVDAVSTDNVILLGFVDGDKESFELVGAPFTQEPYGIGVKKEDTAFRNFVNDTLEKAYTDGRWAKAYADTVGKAGSPTPMPPPVNRY